MIQPHELRIGNLIFDDDGALCKIIGFQPYGHSVRCDESEGCDILIDIYAADGKIRKGFSVESTLVNPIPLTPELLEKCGFVKIESGFTPYGDRDAYVIGEESGRLIWSAGRLLKPIPNGYLRIAQTEIKYIHQLQNLYFAETGEELEIKM